MASCIRLAVSLQVTSCKTQSSLVGTGCTRPPGCLQILVTEVGDETFIIAAIMAMRHARLVVFVGAMSALITMTVSIVPS